MIAPEMAIDLPHVTSRTNKDGTTRVYFRRRGQPVVRLPNEPGSVEFAEAYQRCLNWIAPDVTANEGSFAWLCDQYMNSHDFKTKATATRNARRRVILSMLAERLDPRFPETFGMERAERIGKKHVLTLRDRKAELPNAANERIKVLSQVFKLALARGWRDDNPTRDVARITIKSEGHATATDEQIAQYFAFHKDGNAWLAMKILTDWGVRVSDLRLLGRQHVRNGLIVFDTAKTGVRCELPIGQELLKTLPRYSNQLAFLISANGSAYASEKAMSARVVKWIRQAGIEDITGHSIRKWLATKMAEGGATELQLMSWFGWADPKEARPYIQKANRRKMAGEIGRMRVTQGY